MDRAATSLRHEQFRSIQDSGLTESTLCSSRSAPDRRQHAVIPARGADSGFDPYLEISRSWNLMLALEPFGIYPGGQKRAYGTVPDQAELDPLSKPSAKMVLFIGLTSTVPELPTAIRSGGPPSAFGMIAMSISGWSADAGIS